jgi:hypothetical protein
MRVEHLDDGPPVAAIADDDVARQQQPGAPVDVEGPRGEVGVAGAEDDVVLDVPSIFSRMVALTSISVRTPKPCSLSAALTACTASG